MSWDAISAADGDDPEARKRMVYARMLGRSMEREAMRIIVCGSADVDRMRAVLSEYRHLRPTIVYGDDPGWLHGFRVEVHYADWDGGAGKCAPVFRNTEMAEAGADLCVAFPGDEDMVAAAEYYGIPVRRVEQESPELELAAVS